MSDQVGTTGDSDRERQPDQPERGRVVETDMPYIPRNGHRPRTGRIAADGAERVFTGCH